MAKAEKKKLTGRKRDERVAAYIFVAPAVILLIAFLVVPMIYTVYFLSLIHISEPTRH